MFPDQRRGWNRRVKLPEKENPDITIEMVQQTSDQLVPAWEDIDLRLVKETEIQIRVTGA